MALTYTTALERSEVRARDATRRVDHGDLLLAATSAIALVAIALAYWGRGASFELTEERRRGAPVVNLATVTSVAELEPALGPVVADPIERRLAARHLLEFLQENEVPNVGAILAIAVPRRSNPAETVPLFTTADLALLKPALAVRTFDVFRSALVICTLAYILAFAAVALLWKVQRIEGDRFLLGAAHILTAIGFAILVSRPDPIRDSMLFVRYTQGVVVGLAAMAIVSIVTARRLMLRDLSYVPLVCALALSVALVLFGHGPGRSGVKVNLGPVQPTEAIRLLLALFLAGYFARRWEVLRDARGTAIRTLRIPSWLNIPRPEHVIPVLGGVAAATAFFFLQKDLGPALLLACGFLAMYAVARGHVLLAAAGLSVLVASFYVGYRLNISDTLAGRVMMWQSPWDNAVRGGDQIAQALWALGTGGTFGSGLGLGDTRYLPAGHTDLVLAAIGEELGAVGILVVTAAYVLLAWRGLRIASSAASDYEFFLATSLTLFLITPAVIMAAGVLGLVPLTGVVTPFVSYGGSAMTVNFAALGLLCAIRTERQSSDKLEPFRVPTRRLAHGLAACGICVTAAFTYVQVLRADDYAVRPHLSLQGDGVRRFQYNPRILDVIREIPRGTIFDRGGLPLATSDRDVLARSQAKYASFGVPVDAACLRDGERCYPLGAKTFQLLGDSRTRANWAATNTSYVERDLEDRLRGFDDHETKVTASSIVRRDYREVLPLLRHRYDAGDGDARELMKKERDVRLTIDARLQARVADILAGAARRSATGHAAAVVLDPATGDLLAVASYPWPRAGSDENRETDALLDRARYGLYPPGSTFKLVTAAAALRQDPSMRNAAFSCTRLPDGRVGARIQGWSRPVRDDVLDTHPHGTIRMHDGVVRSCNAYFAQLAVRIGPDALLDAAAPLGITLSRAGSPARLRDVLPQTGYGQGDVLTTPMRMARMAAAFAADGVVRDADVVPAAARRTAVLLPPASARLIARYLRDAVLEGTAQGLKDHPWRIAGKTGTAEVAGAPSHAWFVGFAPYGAATRRIAFAVVIENAGYGGLSAAPVAGEIVTAAAAAGLIR